MAPKKPAHLFLQSNFIEETVTIAVRQLEHAHDLPLPSYATEDSAGMDLVAAIDAPITLQPMERQLIPTGLAIALPPSFEAQIRPRSGLAIKEGITLLNTPGTIDADYRGEIKVIMINLGQQSVTIERGMRIAQMVIAPVTKAHWQPVKELPTSRRGEGGFGSTGYN